MFADDTALVFYGKTWEEARAEAEIGLQVVIRWLRRNILTLNTAKTKLITFGSSRGSIPDNHFKIKAHTCNSLISDIQYCQCAELERVSSIKYLGVLLDQTFTWIPHLTMTAERIRKLIFVFKTLRHVADSKLLKTIYFAMVQSVLSYCVRAWGGASKSHFLKVERAQRALLKVMYFKPFRFPTENLYELSDVLSVRKIFILDSVMTQHKKIDYDERLSQLRKNKNVCPEIRFRTSFSDKFQCFLGPYLYNKINKILKIYSLNKHKCKIKLLVWLKTLSYNNTENLLKVIK